LHHRPVSGDPSEHGRARQLDEWCRMSLAGLHIDPADSCASDGAVGLDHRWMKTLQTEIKNTPLAASLFEAIQGLRELGGIVDVDLLEEIVEGKREEWQDVLYTPAGGFNLPPSYRPDFAVAIYVYTLNDPAVYAAVNREMFNNGRRKPGAFSGISDSLRACLQYIKYLEAALEALPDSYIFQGEVRRGTKWVYPSPSKHDPVAHFPEGHKIMWYEFKSTSTQQEVMMREHFCGVHAGPRTIFTVKATRAYAIHKFSYFQGIDSEHEVLFRPFAKFKVLHAQKNIVDAKELVSTQKSGFPDAVLLQQVCDAEEERLRARALQEAEDARFARALQAEDAAAAAAAEHKRKEEERVAKAAAEKAAAEEAPTAAAAAVKNQKAKPEQGQAAAQKQQVASDAAAFLAQLKSLEAQADAPAIVQGMRAHSENAAVQQEGCAALRSLASNNKVTTAAAGGIGAVLEGMKAHKDSAGVQEAACWALSNFAINDDNAVAIAAAGGIELVVQAMRAHKDITKVQEKACGALRMLAINHDNKLTIAAAGGIELVVQAMKTRKEIAKVQEAACGALQMFALSNGDNAVTISAAGGIEAIAAAMTVHTGSAGVQARACETLENLADYPRLRERIKAAGCVELAKRAVSASDATGITKICGEAFLKKLA
jgi:hypothetical protein